MTPWTGRFSWWLLLHRFNEAKWWVLHRLIPKHRYHVVQTCLKPGYHDFDERILYASMSMLCDYVECEGGDKALEEFSAHLRTEQDPSGGACIRQASSQEEAIAIYRWWKNERPVDVDMHRDFLMRTYGANRVKGEERYAELDRLRKKIVTDEQSMMRRLVEIRLSLWT